jgi:hypothetical protein
MLVMLMAVGSVLMWLGAPVGIIWFAAHTLSKVGSPTVAPLLMIAVALPRVHVREWAYTAFSHPHARARPSTSSANHQSPNSNARTTRLDGPTSN